MADNSTKIVITAVDNASGAINGISGGLRGLAAPVAGLQSAFAGLAAAAGAVSLGKLVMDTVEAGGRLHDLAQSTGATVEALSAIGEAAKLSNTGLDQIGTGLQKLSKNMLDAATGGKDTAAVFKTLDVNIRASGGGLRDSGDTFLDLAKSIDSLGSGTEKAAAAQLVFGKAGAQLLPLMHDLAVAGELQVRWTKEQAALADDVGDNLTRLRATYAATAAEIGKSALPAMKALTDAMLEASHAPGSLSSAIKELAADGTLKEWALGAARAAAMVADVFQGVAGAVAIVGKSIAATMALLTAKGPQEAKAIWAAFKEDVDKQWNPELFSDKLEKAIANLGKKGAEVTIKPKTDFAALLAGLKGAEDEVSKWLAKMRTEMTAADLTLSPETVKSVKLLDQAYARGLIPTLVEYNKLIDLILDQDKVLAAEQKELERAAQDEAKAIEAILKPMEDQLAKLEKEAEFYGMTEQAIQRTLIARLAEAKVIAAANGATQEQLSLWEREIDVRKRIIAAQDSIDWKKAEDGWVKASQDAALASWNEWKKTAEKIEDSLTDALMRGFESGKSFAQNLRDTLVNLFKTLVLRPIIQPVAGGMAGVFGGMFGLSGTANAASGGAGDISNLWNIGSGISSLFSGGLATNSSYLGLAYSGMGQSLGLSTMAATDFTGLLTPGLTELGMGAATALPYIGTALAIASLLGAFDSGGGPKIEGNAIGQFSGGGFGILNTGIPGTAPYGDGDWGRPGGDAPRIGKIVTSLSSDVEKFIEAMGGVTDGLSLFLGFNSDPSGDAPDGVASGVKDAAGNWIYHNVHDVGRGEADEALLVESKKLMLASVQAADGIDAIYKAIAAGVDLTSASADDIDLVIGQLSTAQTALEDAIALFGTELSVGLLQQIAETGETVGDTIARITEEFTGLRAAVAAAKATVAQLSATLFALSHGQNEFNAGLKRTLFGLGASDTAGGGALKANITLDLAQIRELTAAGDTAGALNVVNTGVSDVGAWLSTRTDKINADLAAATKAIQSQLTEELKGLDAQKDAIDLRISGLEEERDAIERATETRISGLEQELDIAREWQGVLESAAAQIKQMMTSLDNPADAAERLRYAQDESDNLRARYLAATGSERAELAQDYLAALNDELKVAQGIYDRPSNEYGAIFDDILGEIRMVQGDAGANTRDAAEIQASIEQLNKEQVDRLQGIDDAIRELNKEQGQLDRQAADLQAAADLQIIALQEAANAQLAAAQAEAVRYYQQFQSIGNSLYEQLKVQTRNDLDLARSQLVTAQAELDVAIASLETEKAILAALTATTATTATAVDGSHAGGLDYVPYDGYIARLHRGEKVLTAAEASGGGKTITINVPVTVNGASDARAAAAEMERAVLRLVPVLKEKLLNA